MNRNLSQDAENKLANYLALTTPVSAAVAAAAIGSTFASQANGAVVANTTAVPFGINGEVNIDFNRDGLTDFQIDHDRVNLNGTELDYLQIDKNDVSSATNPLVNDGFVTFPINYNGDDAWNGLDIAAWEADYGKAAVGLATDGNRDDRVNGQDFLIVQRALGNNPNWDMEYFANLNNCNQFGSGGCHPAALESGASIGPAAADKVNGQFMFTESLNSFGNGTVLRANRLIDEEMGAIDADAGRLLETPLSSPEFTGLGGHVRYLGVRMDLNDAGFPDNPYPGSNGENDADDPANYWYGWIGIEITNEADATGVVTGWAYEDQLGVAIAAGDTGVPISATAVPEPSSMIMAAIGGITLASGFAWRKLFRGVGEA